MEPTQLSPITVYPDGQEPSQAPDNGVSLAAPAQDPDTGVTLSGPGPAPAPIPDEVVTQRAAKIQEGIGEHLQKTTEEIKGEIAAGREYAMRQQAAARMMEMNSRMKMQQAIDLANAKGGPLNPAEVAKIMDPFNPLNRPVDPDSVVEKQYATKYIASISDAVAAVPNNPIAEATNEIPEQVNESFLKGGDLAAKMEIAKKTVEDMEAELGKQSYIGRGVDAIKQMWQPYNEMKMRGLVPDAGYFSGDLGSNLQEQADKLFPLPVEDFAKALKTITTGLAKDNPSLALRFAQYVQGVSSSDRLLDSVFTYMLPLDAAALAKLPINLARKISLYNRTNRGVRDFIRAADRVGTNEAGRAEAAGNIEGASGKKASDLILQDMNGVSDPVKVASDDTLLTFLNQDKEKIAANPGNLTNTQVTKIMDAYDASGKTLLERIINAARINRIPMAVATRNAVRIVQDAVKEYYPGLRNAILDVSNPLYEPKSNTFWHEVTFGNIGGRLFSNPKTAENFAKLHGFDDVKIIEGAGTITHPEIEKMLEQKAALDSNITDWEQTVLRRRAEAGDSKLTLQERAHAKGQADGISEQIKIAKKKSEDFELRLRGKETYNRAKTLETEINQLASRNKELRASRKDKTIDPEVRQHIEDSIAFGEDQIKQKAQEFNAIRQGKADVIGNHTTIEQHGVGFKLVVRRPLVETDKAVRDLLIRDPSGRLIPEATSTGSQTGLKSLVNAVVGKIRGADDTLALNESINRKIATYTQSLFKEWAAQEAKYIRQVASGVIRTDPVTGETIPYWKAKPIALWNKITRQQQKTYNEFTRTLNHARDAKHPDTGETGYFFQTPGELQNHYLTYYDRLPSFAEHEGYFAFVRMVEGDRILRELSEFRNRARVGVEQHSISARGPDGKMVKSEFFDGIGMKNFPGGDDVMMIMSRRLGDEKLVNLGGAGIGPTKLAEYRKLVEEGKLRVIRVYAPEHRPLRNFSDVAGNEHVRYVLTDTVESKPMEFNHVNRRGGGHFEYDYEHFLKQASMYHQYESGVKGRYRSVYTGDTTFMPLLNRAMGRDIADKMHTVQRLIRENDLEGAKRFTEGNLPIEWDELHAMFKPGRDANGKVTPARLDLHEPFVVVPKNRSIYDMDKGLENRYGKGVFKDGTKSGSDNRQFQVAYNTERESSGLRHFEDIGTQGNPLYRYAPEGKMVDPITTMNRSLNRIVNSAFMDDYKIYAVEHWLREAETYLKAGVSEIRSAPFYHFQNASDKNAFKPGTPWETVRNLLSNRYKINQFVGVPNSTDTAIHAATQWLVDTAYNSYGPEASRTLAQKAVTIVPQWMLAHVRDPVTFLRSVTFHAKLGLWAPAQLLVQAQTFATILSIAPRHGMAGTYATLLHTWARMNKSPEILRALDNAATKINMFGVKWKPGEWMEAHRMLESTGFEKVAGEYANLNTALKTDFVGNDLKSIINSGTIFFREGEKSTRLGAFYTAFKEFREVNPTGAISKQELGKILQRADLLTVNMSRASNSMLHTGVFSLTTQFLTYQLRLAELFMGTRMGATPFERAMARTRLLTFYAALYGAPSAIGLTGLPMANAIRQEAIQRGYTPGENFISTAVDVGLPAIAAALITGQGDFRKGALPNFGDRFGSPGFTQFNEAMKSNASWWQLLGGASGTTLLHTLTASNSFFHAIGSMLSPNNKDKAFPMKLDDFVDIFKEISSVNQLWKFIAAVNTGKWMSKNEAYVGDVTKAGAAFYALTGTNPQEQDNAYIKSNIKQAEVEFQKYTLKQFIQEYRRGLQATKDGDSTQASDYFRRAFTRLEIAGYPMDKKATAISIATKGYESQIKSQDYDFAFKNVPQSRSDFVGIPMPFNTQTNLPETRREQFRTQEQLNRYKGQ